VALCSGVLNSLGKFSVPASAPIILNLTLIFSIFVFESFVPNYAYALSYGVFVAGVLQFLWLMFFTIKSGMLLYPKPFSLKLFQNSDIKKFFRKLLPGVIGGNVLQINLLIDSVFASMIVGAVSYLYYADRINQLPLAMIGIAIGIALLPAMSRKIKDGEVEGAIHLQNLALEVGLIMVIPATLALTCLAHPIIVTLFERGKFTHEESFFVAKALQFYSYGLPAYVLVKVMEPAFFSRGDTRTPMTIAIICLFSNAILNAIFFFQGLEFVGIILASIISSYLNLSLLITKLLSKKHFYFEKGFVVKLLKIVVPSVMIIVGLIVYFVMAYFSGSLDILLRSGIFKRKKISKADVIS
jgi:putative peptidoglycan lipid II flippase